MRLPALCTLLLILAGCVEPVGEEAAPATTATTPETAGEAQEDEVAPDDRAPVEVPILLDGVIGAEAGACVFTISFGYCGGVPLGETTNSLEIAERGNATEVALTLTWAAASPSTSELFLAVFSIVGDEFVLHAETFGPSPLSLGIPAGFELTEGGEHHIWIGAPGPSAGTPVGGAFVEARPVDQPFRLEGQFLLGTA